MKLTRALLVFLAVLTTSTGRASYLDDIGWNDLLTRYGTNLNRGEGVRVAQVEAPESTATNYVADTNSAIFAGKVFTFKSGAGGVSSHATGVGSLFYGLNAVASAVTNIDAYEANNFVGPGVLKFGTASTPSHVTPARVMNNSWIGGGLAEHLRRVDYVCDVDGITICSGLNNTSSSNVALTAVLMAQSYNGIGVGLTQPPASLNYSEIGPSTTDTVGRAVAMLTLPVGDTSSATAVTSSCASLLIGTALQTPALTNAADPRTIKALLLATAARMPGWQHGNAGTNDDQSAPLDWAQGAGRLQINHAYDLLLAGEMTTNAPTGTAGWDRARIGAGATNYYFFDVPTNYVATTTASLVWNRHVTIAMNSTFTNRNLDLALGNATGLVATTTLARSTSLIDNIEFLFATNLAAGRYSLAVTGGAAAETNALAFWSDLVPVLTVTATDGTASEFGANPGTFTLARPDTNGTLTALYALAGSASNGVDFTTLTGAVTFAAGTNAAVVTITPVTDALVEGLESVNLTLLASTNYALPTNAAAMIVIDDLPFDAWRFNYFAGSELTNTAILGPLADPERDGIPNLLEYALGADPRSSDAAFLPQPLVVSADGTNYLALAFRQPLPVPADLLYQPEFSNDLLAWSTNAVFLPPATTNGDGTQTVIFRDAVPAGDHRDARLRVLRP